LAGLLLRGGAALDSDAADAGLSNLPMLDVGKVAGVSFFDLTIVVGVDPSQLDIFDGDLILGRSSEKRR
jgi:hypothetical protein